MPNSSNHIKKKTRTSSLKKTKKTITSDKKPNTKTKQDHPHIQKAGSSEICQKDINQLLMGNPPISIGDPDVKSVWKDTKRTAKELDSYSKKGWGDYPGTPPKPDCTIL